MRIGIQTWGSEGDLRPFVALARGLKQAGHDVELHFVGIAPYDTTALVALSGVNITRVGAAKARSAAEADAIMRVWTQATDVAQQATILREQLFAPHAAELTESAAALARRSDFLIGHALLHPLRCAAERWRKPEVSVTLANTWYPATWRARSIVHRGVNAALGVCIRQVLNRHFLSFVNEARVGFGLPPWRDVASEAWRSPFLNLIAVSPSLCRDADRALNPVCGFLRLPDEGARVSANIERFLDAGEAPVFVTFGSHMPKAGAPLKATVALLVLAAQGERCRVIVQVPEAELGSFAANETALFVGATAHSLVFPRCRAVIHHGGAGTAQEACASGKPSVVVPHVGDQFFWADQLWRAGLSSQPVARRALSVGRLRAALREVLRSPTINERATRLRTICGSENGVQVAVNLIEHKLEQSLLRSKNAMGRS